MSTLKINTSPGNSTSTMLATVAPTPKLSTLGQALVLRVRSCAAWAWVRFVEPKASVQTESTVDQIKDFLYSCLNEKDVSTLNRIFTAPHETINDVLVTEDKLDSFGKQALRIKIDLIAGLYRPVEESPRQSQDNE
jgi:hypothetical protein